MGEQVNSLTSVLRGDAVQASSSKENLSTWSSEASSLPSYKYITSRYSYVVHPRPPVSKQDTTEQHEDFN